VIESTLGTVEVAVSPEEKFREFLATQSQRMTRERAIIVEEVFASHEHFDADQLIGRLAQRSDGRRVSRSSIYRTLSLLEEAGLIRKVARQDDKDVFEHDYGYPQHDHFICGRCGTLIEFHDERIAAVLDEMSRLHNFRMEGHRMEVYGLCGKCAGPPATRPRKLNLL
jgi:Fur family ferric uptake transcriptional regulator